MSRHIGCALLLLALGISACSAADPVAPAADDPAVAFSATAGDDDSCDTEDCTGREPGPPCELLERLVRDGKMPVEAFNRVCKRRHDR